LAPTAASTQSGAGGETESCEQSVQPLSRAFAEAGLLMLTLILMLVMIEIAEASALIQ